MVLHGTTSGLLPEGVLTRWSSHGRSSLRQTQSVLITVESSGTSSPEKVIETGVRDFVARGPRCWPRKRSSAYIVSKTAIYFPASVSATVVRGRRRCLVYEAAILGDVKLANLADARLMSSCASAKGRNTVVSGSNPLNQRKTGQEQHGHARRNAPKRSASPQVLTP